MERDKRLTELVKEHGVFNAPEGLIEDVLDKITVQPSLTLYRPIIHRGVIYGAIAVFVIAIIVFSQTAEESFREPLFSIPNLDFSFPDISPLLSTGLAAGIVGIFFLMLTEYSLRRRRG
jgi:hypothetical protein